MKDLLYKRLANLVTVKSLVTVIMTVVFAVQTCRGTLDSNFMTIYASVCAFYFGIQSVKEKMEDGGNE